mmetsp:Transcript_28975/g.43774  ORF Transcript_28975/g.43774 Transcript_28975/m.43774 type:complete len:459 (-) Transcript_28975:98-1474(-)
MGEQEQFTETSTLLDNYVESSSGYYVFCKSKKTAFSFYLMAILFSANIGCTVSCISLATSRLGLSGAWQSSILAITYTLSSIIGSTYVVKKFGARDSIAAGMSLACFYMASFWLARTFPKFELEIVLLGAGIGGIGAGFLWTAYGEYLKGAARCHSEQSTQNFEECTASFARIFAFIFLTTEVMMRGVSTILVEFTSWKTVFVVYTLIACIATWGMAFVDDYGEEYRTDSTTTNGYQLTAAVRLLVVSRKMKYMVGMTAVFGLASAFVNAYLNCEVVRLALGDENSRYVGVLSAWISMVAAIASLLLKRVHDRGVIVICGAMAFFFVAFPFLVQPDARRWSIFGLMIIYTLQGIGRATFESTLKAIFVEYFPDETAGAFSNISLHYGMSNALGNLLSFRSRCSKESRYCIRYSSDGELHDIFGFEVLVCVTAILAIAGYYQASVLHRKEDEVGKAINV